MNRGNIAVACVSLVPWLHIAASLLFVARAYASLGHWPSYNRPDPKTLGFVVHHSMVWLTLIPALYSPIAVLPWVIAFWRKLRGDRSVRTAAFVYVAGTAVTWAVWSANLAGFSEWFAD